jgi:hypothetical protein
MIYSTLNIVKALGIPRERLRDWMNRGYIAPSIPAKGQGTKAVFSRLDVYSIALFRHLVEDMHFSREEASKFAKGWLRYISNLRKKVEGVEPERALARFISNELIFTFATKNGERKLLYTPYSFLGKDRDRFKNLMTKVEQTFKDKTWDDIVMINFRKIMDNVDSLLKALE